MPHVTISSLYGSNEESQVASVVKSKDFESRTATWRKNFAEGVFVS